MPVGEGGGQGAGDIFVMWSDESDVRRLTDDAFEEGTPILARSAHGTVRRHVARRVCRQAHPEVNVDRLRSEWRSPSSDDPPGHRPE